jgi:hypothetical protein
MFPIPLTRPNPQHIQFANKHIVEKTQMFFFKLNLFNNVEMKSVDAFFK